MDETIEKQKGQLTSLFSHYHLDIQYSFHFSTHADKMLYWITI